MVELVLNVFRLVLCYVVLQEVSEDSASPRHREGWFPSWRPVAVEQQVGLSGSGQVLFGCLRSVTVIADVLMLRCS